MRIIKTFFVIAFIFVSCFGQAVAQEGQPPADEIFTAKVISVLKESTVTLESGAVITQQDLRLKGLDGNWKDKEFEHRGIGSLEVISSQKYKEGDEVIVNRNVDVEGNEIFNIVDNNRLPGVYVLGFLFLAVLLAIGGWKGLKSLISLSLTIAIILGFAIPRIFNGADPVLTAILSSAAIVVLVIYLTEGWNRLSHLSVASIFATLIISFLLSWFFIGYLKLSGRVDETVLFLSDSSKVIDFSGLLLAGIIFGTIGVLDDVVISQLTAVREIKVANPQITNRELYSQARKIGVAHLSSMTNTLFLAYAGVSLPLLLLFFIKQPPFLTVSQVLNSEMIATEIARTFLGSIGLILAMPIATFLGAKYLKN